MNFIPDSARVHVDYYLDAAKPWKHDDCLDTARIQVHDREAMEEITKFFRERGWKIKITRTTNAVIHEDEHPLCNDCDHDHDDGGDA